MANELITEMQSGNVNAIIGVFAHPGAIYRMNAIAYAALFRLGEAEVEGTRAFADAYGFEFTFEVD